MDLKFSEKNKLKSFNDRKISGENYFGEELINNNSSSACGFTREIKFLCGT